MKRRAWTHRSTARSPTASEFKPRGTNRSDRNRWELKGSNPYSGSDRIAPQRVVGVDLGRAVVRYRAAGSRCGCPFETTLEPRSVPPVVPTTDGSDHHGSTRTQGLRLVLRSRA